MNQEIQESYEQGFFEQDIYKDTYVEDLVEDDAISHEEAAFLAGYNS